MQRIFTSAHIFTYNANEKGRTQKACKVVHTHTAGLISEKAIEQHSCSSGLLTIIS